MTTQAGGLITVRLDVAAAHDEEFNDWYQLEHMPQLTAMPGFVRTRRYFCEKSNNDRTDMRYLAWYETADETVEAARDFQHIVANPTPWSQRMRKLYGDRRERMNFKLMCEVGGTPVDAPWMYIVHTDIPDHIIDEYNEWYDKEHLPRCAGIPGVLRARRYMSTGIAGSSNTAGPRYLTAYELTGPDVWESPAAQLARKTPWTEKMRSLFSNTRRVLYRLVAPTVTHEQAASQKRISVA